MYREVTQNEERTLKDRYTLQTSDSVFLKGFQNTLSQTEAQDLLFQRSDSVSGESMGIKHHAAFKIEPLAETMNFLTVPHKINRVG